jgi:20S proteasome alpha/beta subunit
MNTVCSYQQPMGALQRWKAAAIGSHSKDACKVLQSAAAVAAAATSSKHSTTATAADNNSCLDKDKRSVSERELVAQILSALQATSLHTRTRGSTVADSSGDTERYSKAVTGVTVHVLRADGTHELYTQQQLIDMLKSSEKSGGDHAAAAT